MNFCKKIRTLSTQDDLFPGAQVRLPFWIGDIFNISRDYFKLAFPDRFGHLLDILVGVWDTAYLCVGMWTEVG